MFILLFSSVRLVQQNLDNSNSDSDNLNSPNGRTITNLLSLDQDKVGFPELLERVFNSEVTRLPIRELNWNWTVKLLLNFTGSRYIAFKAKIAQINDLPFFISVVTKVINLVSKKRAVLKFWTNLNRYINISVPEFLQRIFFFRTGPLKESERPILYRPFI